MSYGSRLQSLKRARSFEQNLNKDNKEKASVRFQEETLTERQAPDDSGPSKCYVGPRIPMIGRVPAGDDLPNWTVERAQALDGTWFVLYRDPSGRAIGSRQSALVFSGQLEIPASMHSEMEERLRNMEDLKRMRKCRLRFSKSSVRALQESFSSGAHTKWTCDGLDYWQTVDSYFSKKSLRAVRTMPQSSKECTVHNVVVIDLFCGIGGFSLGFAAHGCVVYGVDNSEAAIAAYSFNECGDGYVKRTIRHEDVGTWQRAFQTSGIGASSQTCNTESRVPLILIGGPPCQPFSVAGNKSGSLDHRDCMKTTIDLAIKIRPDILLLENVPSLMNEEFSSYVQPLLRSLQDAGYTVEPVVHRCWRHRVAQHRSRLIIQCVRVVENCEKISIKVTSAHDSTGKTCSPPLPMDVITSDNFWSGKCPDNLRLDDTLMKARRRVKNRENATACVYGNRLSPTIMTTSAHGNSYHRLMAIPCDVSPSSLTYEDARRVGVRECLGLQSFPSEFDLYGSLASQSTAVGNAVPPLFAYDVAKSAIDTLSKLNSESVKVTRVDLLRRLIEFDKTVCETIRC